MACEKREKVTVCPCCGAAVGADVQKQRNWKHWVKKLTILAFVIGGAYGLYCGYREFRPCFCGLYDPEWRIPDLSFDIDKENRLTIPHPRNLPTGFTIAREYTTHSWRHSCSWADRGFIICGEFESEDSALAAVKSQMWTYARDNWTIVLSKGGLLYFKPNAYYVWCVWGGCERLGDKIVGYIAAQKGITDPPEPGTLDNDAERCLLSIGVDNHREEPLCVFGIEMGSQLGQYEPLAERHPSPFEYTQWIKPPRSLTGFETYAVSYTPISKKIWRIEAVSRNPLRSANSDPIAGMNMDDMPPHNVQYYVDLFRKKYGIKGKTVNTIGFNKGKQLAVVHENAEVKCLLITFWDFELYEQYIVECERVDKARKYVDAVKESVQARKDIQSL